MFDYDYNPRYDINYQKRRKQLHDAWEKFYTPMQLSQAKFRIKVQMRMRKNKFPTI